MIFEPYQDELDIINNVHKYNDNEYTVIRLTKTMIDKNNIDTNILLRDLLKNSYLVNYDLLDNGGTNGEKKDNVLFLSNDSIERVTMNFYKVNNNRSDPRFSIHGIGQMQKTGKVNVGDLLYITVLKSPEGNELIILNATRNTPTDNVLLNAFGSGEITEAANRLILEIKKIAKQGFHPNSKGKGKIVPKDVGDTLEYLLGIETNNSKLADFEDLIEIKSKAGETLDTLFTLRPQFLDTLVAEIEPKDRSRVSAFTRLYGYDSDKHKGYKSLYVTIGTKSAPQNKVGLFLAVNEEERKVEIRKWVNEKKHECAAYWTFESLKQELHCKHPATLWVEAEQDIKNDIGYFKYHKAELSREPQFTTFLSLIESGGITYDWRGYTTPLGKYQGKNHGNAWRIRKKYRELLFGNIEEIDLL